MTTAAPEFRYRVTNISDAQNGRVTVTLVQVTDEAVTPVGVQPPNTAFGFGGNLNLNLASEDAKAYWPGGEFTMSLAPVS